MSRANARAERALRLDIAAREEAERALAETRQVSINAAKMAALGEMSANVAHEVNNPLAAILLRAERLEKLANQGRLDAPAALRTAREIGGTAQRIRRIIDALRSFARQGDADPVRPEPVLTIVSDTVELSAQRYRLSGIDLVVDPISSALHVDCRATQISQILMNLLSNAHDAVERTPNTGSGSASRSRGTRCESPSPTAGAASRRDRGPHHGAVLHHQGDRSWHRPRALGLEGDCRGPGRAARARPQLRPNPLRAHPQAQRADRPRSPSAGRAARSAPVAARAQPRGRPARAPASSGSSSAWHRLRSSCGPRLGCCGSGSSCAGRGPGRRRD